MSAKNQRGILAFSLATSLSLYVLTAKAEEASTNISVFAGLEPVMTLECTPINFGVYQVARGDRGIGLGPTIVFLEESRGGTITTAFENEGTDKIALSDKPEYGSPQLGECTIKSSRVRNNDLYITRDPAEDTALDFSGEGANPFASSLNAPITQVNGIVAKLFVDERDSSLIRTDDEGNAVFKIVGELNIPNNLTAENYGSYKGAALTITVSDTP